jgi:membrane protein
VWAKIAKLPVILWKSIVDAVKHDGVEHAGYLSFLLMLSIFPFLVFFVAILGAIGDSYGIADHLVSMILESGWSQFISSIKPRIKEITSSPPQGLMTLAIVAALWTASSIFEALRTILNRAYRVSTPPSYLFRRLVSFAEFGSMIVITSIVVFILIIMPSVWALIYKYVSPIDKYTFGFFSADARVLRSVIMTIYSVFVISGLYYFLPNQKQKFSKTIPGTIGVGLCWKAFSYLFAYYVKIFPTISVIYGSITGVIVTLLYFYICSLIFIIGAEFNYHFAKAK